MFAMLVNPAIEERLITGSSLESNASKRLSSSSGLEICCFLSVAGFGALIAVILLLNILIVFVVLPSL